MEIKKCAIAQPTFMPWIGWFDLVDQVDVMILLDDVAFSKQSWQQRNRIRTAKGLEFITVPVITSNRQGQLIKDCELENNIFAKKIIKTIQHNYNKTKYFKSYFEELSTLILYSANSRSLLELNCGIIFWMIKKLQINTKIIKSSSINAEGKRGEYVAAICENIDAKKYISTAGAEEYLLKDKKYFEIRKIQVELQEYKHPEYAQIAKEFIPYASAIDLLFNVGPEAGSVMRVGRMPNRVLIK